MSHSPQALAGNVGRPAWSFSRLTPFRAVAIDGVAVIVGPIRKERFAKVKRRGRAGATAILPFRFRGQTIGPLIDLPNLLDERLAIVPGNRFHWQAVVAPEAARIIAHHDLPLLLGDGMNAHVKAFAQGGLVWHFIRLPVDFVLRASHHEGAGRNPREFHAEEIGEGGRRSIRLCLRGTAMPRTESVASQKRR